MIQPMQCDLVPAATRGIGAVLAAKAAGQQGKGSGLSLKRQRERKTKALPQPLRQRQQTAKAVPYAVVQA